MIRKDGHSNDPGPFRRNEVRQEASEASEILEKRVTHRAARLDSANKELQALLEEKTRISKALRKSETRYRSLVESTDDFIYLVNEKGEYLFMNVRTRTYYGLSPDAVEGRNYEEFHTKRQTRVFLKQVRHVFLNKCSLVQEHHGQDRRYYLRTLSPVTEPDGDVSLVTVISKDITGQKNLEAALVSSNERLRAEEKRRITLSKRLIDLLEEERHRISRDLHDQVGQVLTSLKMDLENIYPSLVDENPVLSKKIAQAAAKAGGVLGDIKTISSQLRPSILDAFGLARAIAQLLKDMESSGVETKFFCRDVPEHFHPEKELAIYRIAQEALHNILKHAQARRVHVALTKRKGTLCLSVEDNGIGFNPKKLVATAEGKKPLGLLIMQERAFQQGGELTVDAMEGRGAHILAEIPF